MYSGSGYILIEDGQWIQYSTIVVISGVAREKGEDLN
jgi:hypothetical protein